jgi:hypothetical protein
MFLFYFSSFNILGLSFSFSFISSQSLRLGTLRFTFFLLHHSLLHLHCLSPFLLLSPASGRVPEAGDSAEKERSFFYYTILFFTYPAFAFLTHLACFRQSPRGGRLCGEEGPRYYCSPAKPFSLSYVYSPFLLKPIAFLGSCS